MLAPLILLVGAHAASVLPSAVTGAPAAPLDKSSRQIDAFLTDCAAFGWSGTCHVAKGKKVILSKGYGYADDEAGRPCDEETLFNVGTMTQALTATAAIQLVEARKFSLGDTVFDVLGAGPSAAGDVTIESILRDVSGFKGRARVGSADDFEAAIGKILGADRSGPAGESYRPWPGGYGLLAGIIEAKGAESFEAYVLENVLVPAGAKGSGFVGGAFEEGRLALGYERGDEPRRADAPAGRAYGWNVRGSSGAVMTASGFANFMIAFESGRLGKGEAFSRAIRRGPDDRGFGWGINRDYQASCDRLERAGETRGFRSFASLNLGTGVTCVLLSNRGNAPARFMDTVVRNFVSGEKMPVKQSTYPPETVTWKGKDLDTLAGTWGNGDGVELELERYGETSLRARAFRAALLASASGGVADPRRAVFAPIEKRVMTAHAWVEAATVARLEWNGKRGAKAEIRFTEPDGRTHVLTIL